MLAIATAPAATRQTAPEPHALRFAKGAVQRMHNVSREVPRALGLPTSGGLFIASGDLAQVAASFADTREALVTQYPQAAKVSPGSPFERLARVGEGMKYSSRETAALGGELATLAHLSRNQPGGLTQAERAAVSLRIPEYTQTLDNARSRALLAVAALESFVPPK